MRKRVIYKITHKVCISGTIDFYKRINYYKNISENSQKIIFNKNYDFENHKILTTSKMDNKICGGYVSRYKKNNPV